MKSRRNTTKVSKKSSKNKSLKRTSVLLPLRANGVLSYTQATYLHVSSVSNFDGCLPLCSLYPGDGYTQRGADDSPKFHRGKVFFDIEQTPSQLATYRVIGITIHSPFTVPVSSGIYTMPTTWVMETNWSNNTYSNPIAFRSDQNKMQFSVWLDKIFTVDTENGCQSLSFLTEYEIPATICKFATNDVNGTKSTGGMQYFLMYSDAPVGDINYGYNLSFRRYFSAKR
jgi:hypothetical protein